MVAGLATNLTPLIGVIVSPIFVLAWLPATHPMVLAVLILSYTALLLSFALFIDSGPADMIYLDMGQNR